MSIGTIIKRLRRERDITQEQLAEYLNISAQAISQWECDRNAPDISQLPALANIFEVSADVLLGIDVSIKDKRIDEIVEKSKEYWNGGYNAEGANILREGLKEYPNSYKLMSWLMSCVWKERDEPQNTDKRDEMTKEVISLGEKIVAECTDDDIRRNAIQILCYTYPGIGESVKAIALAEKMPTRWLTKESLLGSIYSGNKRYESRRDDLFERISDLYTQILFNNAQLDDGSRPYTSQECILLHKKLLAIMDIIFEDKNYGFCMQTVAWTYISLAVFYAKLKDNDSAIENLKIATEYSIKNDLEYDPEKKYTCLLFRGKKFGGVTHSITENDSLHQLEEMKDPVFDSIRNNREFIEIEESLKKHAAKH